MNKIILIIIVILVVIIGGYFLLSEKEQTLEEIETQQSPSLKVPAPGFESVPETVVMPNEKGSELLDESVNSEPVFIPAPIEHKISMNANNFSFSPSSLSVNKGDTVTIAMSTSGSHTFTINELSVNESLIGGFYGSGNKTFSFIANRTGTFEYYCSVGGHRGAGMTGSLIVE